MEVCLRSSNGVPDDAVISVRAGNVRKQATVGASRSFTFPTAEENRLRFDVMSRIGAGHAILKPMSFEASTVYKVALSEAMWCEVEVKRHTDGLPQTNCNLEDSPVKLSPAAGAKEAKDYLEKKGLLTFLQGVLHVVIKEKPEDPYTFMARCFMNGFDDVPHATADCEPPKQAVHTEDLKKGAATEEVKKGAAASPDTDGPQAAAASPDTDVPAAAAASPDTDAPTAAAASPDTDAPKTAAASPDTDAPQAAPAIPDPDVPKAAAVTPEESKVAEAEAPKANNVAKPEEMPQADAGAKPEEVPPVVDVKEEPAKQDPPEPKKEEAVPTKEEAVPTKEEAAPKKEEAAPKKEEAAPKTEEAAPKKEEATPTKDVVQPQQEAAVEHIPEKNAAISPPAADRSKSPESDKVPMEAPRLPGSGPCTYASVLGKPSCSPQAPMMVGLQTIMGASWSHLGMAQTCLFI